MRPLKIAIIGAGSVGFTKKLFADIVSVPELRDIEFALTDISGLKLSPFWLAIGGLFLVERVITVRAAGLRGLAVAGTFVLEMLYDVFQQAVYLIAAWNCLRGREARWHHIGEEVTT